MPRYLVVRPIPDAGKLSPAELQGIAARSNGVLAEMRAEGKQVRWDHSYVSGDAIHCVYEASAPEVIREHARRGGFPCEVVSEISARIDPTTAN